jgi:hypothetical protein
MWLLTINKKMNRNFSIVLLVVCVALVCTAIVLCCLLANKPGCRRAYVPSDVVFDLGVDVEVAPITDVVLELNSDTDIILCELADSQFMEEYLRFIIQKTTPALPLFLYYIDSDTSLIYDLKRMYPERTRYVCVRRVPDALLKDTKASIVFINTEQLTAPHKLREFKLFTKRPDIQTFDYSKANMRISKLPRHGHLPLEENKEETMELKAMMAVAYRYPRKIAVVGSPTDRRLRLVEQLSLQGMDVVFIQGFGTERDELIAECAVLLNLHAFPEYTLYESLRCDRWLYAGMPVVTEPCSDMESIPSGVVVAASASVNDIASALSEVFASTG